MFSNKFNSNKSKPSSNRFNASIKSVRNKPVNPKRVLTSKKLPPNSSNDRKSYSAGVINTTVVNPKKKTKSEFKVFAQNVGHIDYCKHCGDVLSAQNENTSSILSYCTSKSTKSNLRKSNPSVLASKKVIPKPSLPPPSKSTLETEIILHKSVQQYYKNVNYNQSTDSIAEISSGLKKISLDTIKEVPEIPESLIKIFSNTDNELKLDADLDSIQDLKEFRQKNYFECHSTTSRVQKKGSVTSLQDHKCVYRFYLNHRLFPVPLSEDYNNQIRCIECHLPMESNVHEPQKINGTIQAKVTLGNKTQDVMLLLPVKEPLIMKERRKEVSKEKDVLYFGVINLDGFGNSMFNPTSPENSFALKYQKGYKEFCDKNKYEYKELDKEDVIVI